MNPSKHPSLDNGDVTRSTHSMAQSDNYSYPSVIQREEGGALERLEDDEAYQYAMDTGEYEQHSNDEEAYQHSMDYKRLSNEPELFEK